MLKPSYKICDICKFKTNTTDETVIYGDWQRLNTINVHYFCLLLSTNLPQKGEDNSGINGFLKRDIRAEITAANERGCCYCGKRHASIACWKCKEYFHLVCGHRNDCLFQFRDEFRSYCSDCIPLDEFQKKALQNPLPVQLTCYICKLSMPSCNAVKNIYAACCGNGYVHHKCMQKYALAAGYYLKCIWCKASSFREHVRMHGIFVPDRDAKWELERGAYRDLHRGHKRCDTDPCLCPHGRDFVNKKWSLIICSLCGSFGAHNPMCIPGKSKSKTPVEQYKCETCSGTELMIAMKNQTLTAAANDTNRYSDCVDTSIYMAKQICTHKDNDQQTNESPTFCDSESLSSHSSTITVIPRRSSLYRARTNSLGSKTLKLHPSKLQEVASKAEGNEGSRSACNADLLIENAINIPASPSILASPSANINANKDEMKLETQMIDEHNYSAKSQDIVNISASSSNAGSQAVTPDVLNEDIIDISSQIEATPALVNENTTNIATSAPNFTMPAATNNEIIGDTNLETQTINEHNYSSAQTKEIAHAALQPPSSSDDIFDDCTPSPLEFNNYGNRALKQSDNIPSSSSSHTMPAACPEPHTETSQNFEEQSPIISTTSQENNDHDDFITFDMFKFDDTRFNCIGISTIRISMSDPRFVGKTLAEIQKDPDGLIEQRDVIEENNSIGIFEEINKIIAEYQ